jgi:hypothetical protein
MHDLIYLSLSSLATFDPYLESDQYRHHDWFRLYKALEWPNHMVSRVHKLHTPWNLAGTVCPIPDLQNATDQFDLAIETVADRFVRQVQDQDLEPYLCYSGGIDSTSILVSLLKTAPTEFLQRLTILYNENSIKENAYFWHRFIHNRLRTQHMDTFQVTADNYRNLVVLDGEGGNQCMGWRAINTLIYYREFDFLDQHWCQVPDLTSVFPGGNQFHVDLVKESIEHAPIPIETVYDFIWWANFNYKFDEVLLRKMLVFTDKLNASQSQQFFQQNMYRFYAQPELQAWSMLSKDQRREKTRIVGKYFPKQYIYQFDHNELWWANKKEEGSNSRIFYNSRFAFDNSIIALDAHWNKYNIADQDTRHSLADILQRNIK